MDLSFTALGRWYRLGAFYGQPPGSHKGFWVTKWPPLYGWNLRLGSYKHSLTLLIHTRRK